MTGSEVNWITLILLVSLFMSFGIYGVSKTKNEAHFLLAGRKTGMFALIATLVMTEFNATTLVSYSAAGYTAGIRALWLPIVILSCLIFYAITVSKRWKEFNGISIANYFTYRYSKSLGYTASIIMLVTMLVFTATYIKSITLIFQPILPAINGWLLSGILTFLVLLVSVSGGLKAIIRTDIMSFIAVLIFFPILMYFTIKMPDLHASAIYHVYKKAYQVIPCQFILSMMVIGPLSYISAPWYGQKIISAKSKSVAFYAVLCAAILLVLLYGIGVLCTHIFSIKYPLLKSPQLALPMLLNVALPEGLQGVGWGILFCIAATTISSAWSAMVTIVIGIMPLEDSNIKVMRSVCILIIVAVVVYLVTNLYVDQIFSKMLLLNIPITSLCFAVLAGFYWRRASSFGAYLSIFVGISSGIICYYLYGDKGDYLWYWFMIGVPLIFLSGFIGSIVKSKCHLNHDDSLTPY